VVAARSGEGYRDGVPKLSTLLVIAALVVGGVVAWDHFGRNARIATQTVIGQPVELTSDAAVQAASANVSTAAVSLEAYRAANGTYSGATGIPAGVRVVEADDSTYCIESTVHGETVSDRGPNGRVVAGGC